MVCFELTDPLLGRDELRYRDAQRLLEGVSFAPRRRDRRFDRFAGIENVTSRISDSTGHEYGSVFGEAQVYGRLNQHAVGQTILDELLSLGDRQSLEADASGSTMPPPPSIMNFPESSGSSYTSISRRSPGERR